MENRSSEYYIGLDMGTSSVGWAVTDPSYHLLRAKGKDMWGARLFDPGQTAAERRTFRVARRRRQRETARIGELKNYFADAIEQVDPEFYIRLEESKYYLEDRSINNQQKFGLFNDKDYTDVDYYSEFPTIFHLRSELIHSEEPHDVRLVFLALLNMFKHRGHFLNKTLGIDGGTGELDGAFQELIRCGEMLDLKFSPDTDTKALESLLARTDLSRSRKREAVAVQLGISKKDAKEYEIIGLMCGLKGKMVKIFGEEIFAEEKKNFSISYRDSGFEEEVLELETILGEEGMDLFHAIKEVHDIGLLSSIMKGHKYLSDARLESFNDHAQDLEDLKAVLKQYLPDQYAKMFRKMSEDNYSAYVGSVNSYGKVKRRGGGKGWQSEVFYKHLGKVLEGIPKDVSDARVVRIRARIESEEFLPKQMTASNGVIPNQLHAAEMKVILKNASGYLPFLNEKDESGLTVAERILRLYTFQIPYYVGPLGQQYRDVKGYNVWAERIAPGKIYPWNLEEKIDVEGAAEKFISRMVRRCTYLTGEQAIPKSSLLYEKYMVLNELNNLKINGERISVDLKQEIYQELFAKGKKVTLKTLVSYLASLGIIKKNDTDAISGIDGDFKASLGTQGKMLRVLNKDHLTDQERDMVEKIIFWTTVYGDDKKFLRNRIQKEYKDVLTKDQIKALSGMKFAGWGRFSSEFLNMEGASKEDGVIRSLIGALWETNCNLMELLSSQFTYMEELEKRTKSGEKPLSDWTVEDLEDLNLSPSVKRMVWQTLKLVREIRDIKGYDPKRIFIEMAREDGEKGKRTISRKNQLLELYKKEDKALRDAINSQPEQYFRIKKVYLYYHQLGRCMYTGEPIDLDDLFNDNLYDIDHIYAQHYIKDDSLDNNMVLVKKENNAHKSDTYPIESGIQNKMHGFWKELMDKGLITKTKYERLTRKTEFTEDELAAFIDRQLVETRQGTKAVTQIFNQAFPEVTIVFSKAGLVSDFRNKFDLHKVRCLNDFHHAKDAYLNVVVGNTYYVKFTSNPRNFIKNAQKNAADPRYKYHMTKLFERDVVSGGEQAWIASDKEMSNAGTISLVKKVMRKNSPLITRRSYRVHGGLTLKSTIWSAETAAKAKAGDYLPMKSGDSRLSNVARYGGVTSIQMAGYSLVEYEVKGKTVRSLEAVPIYLGDIEKISEEKLTAYLKEAVQREYAKDRVENLKVRMKLIRQRSLIRIDGFLYYIAGKTSGSIYMLDAVPLCLSPDQEAYVKKVSKATENGRYDEVDDQKQAVITAEKNLNLYESLTRKLTDSIFKNKRCSIAGIVENGKEKFTALDVEKQCRVLMNIIDWFNTAKQNVDLTEIGGSAHSGTLTISKKISGYTEVCLIEQSATGLLRREIDLLKV